VDAVIVYARLYAHCLIEALKGISKNLWTLILPIALLVAFGLVLRLLSPFGIIGGIAGAFILDGLLSCYLYFLAGVVGRARVGVTDFRRSVGAYFWSIVNLNFVLWIASFMVNSLLQGNRNERAFQAIYALATFVLLNAVPEVLYQKGTWGGLATIQKTISFIQESWIEWFFSLPNMVLAALIVWLNGAAALLVAVVQTEPLLTPWLLLPAIPVGALVHVVMVFRGHLFQELDSSTHRQRMFKFRKLPQ